MDDSNKYHWKKMHFFPASPYGVTRVHIKCMTLDTIHAARFALSRIKLLPIF